MRGTVFENLPAFFQCSEHDSECGKDWAQAWQPGDPERVHVDPQLGYYEGGRQGLLVRSNIRVNLMVQR